MEHKHIIHLNNVVRTPNTRKANRAVFAVKNYVKKHTHVEPKNIRLSNEVNEVIWERGKKHKVNRLQVTWRMKEDKVYVFTPAGKELEAFEKTLKESKAATKEKKETKKEAPAKEKKVDLKEKKTATVSEKEEVTAVSEESPKQEEKPPAVETTPAEAPVVDAKEEKPEGTA